MFELTVPSKTFLLGEYVALKGGPVLVLTTEKYFKLLVTLNREQKIDVQGIHMKSPAGKLIKSKVDFYKHYAIKFIDPYPNLGGFGASTAQFIMVMALKKHISSQSIQDVEFLEEYNKFAWDGEGIPPSGADLVSQLHGKICFFHKVKKEVKTFVWPFSDVEYGLIHTGSKLVTYTYLKKLSDFNELALAPIVQAALVSLNDANSKSFIECIKNYADVLQAQDLVAEKTQEILKLLAENPDILACKGCGALGADVILILFKSSKKNDVISWVKENMLNLVVCGQKTAHGLDIKEI